MTAHAIEHLHGVRQIVRFNWPFYSVAVALVVLAPLVIVWVPGGSVAHMVLLIATGLAAFWTIGSLAASWFVYDRSPLMTGDWIRGALGYSPRTWINIHAGFDEMTPKLRAHFADSQGCAFDIFDAAEMSEPSIVRAREACASGSDVADYRRLPAPAASTDAVFLLLAAHELRTHEARCALFREVHRVVEPGRRVVVAEHLRDAANLAAYGPGAFHFHSRRAWMRCYAETGFSVDRELSITPFVRVFVLATDFVSYVGNSGG
jgi:hypothetical protein